MSGSLLDHWSDPGDGLRRLLGQSARQFTELDQLDEGKVLATGRFSHGALALAHSHLAHI